MAVLTILVQDWSMIRGTILREGGPDLLNLDPASLYDVGYAYLMQQVTMYEDQSKAQDQLRTRFARLLKDDDEGLPPIAALIPPADTLGRPNET